MDKIYIGDGIMINLIDFIEKYCIVNGKHIKLSNYQKKFIKWIDQLKFENDIRIL